MMVVMVRSVAVYDPQGEKDGRKMEGLGPWGSNSELTTSVESCGEYKAMYNSKLTLVEAAPQKHRALASQSMDKPMAHSRHVHWNQDWLQLEGYRSKVMDA
jgi:hypothetical protein